VNSTRALYCGNVKYRYRLIPIGPVTHIGGEAVAELTLSSDERFATGDTVPVSPGIWTVERIGDAGTTHWASESVSREDPRTETSPLRLYCRVEA
jgi:hypothetical protein